MLLVLEWPVADLAPLPAQPKSPRPEIPQGSLFMTAGGRRLTDVLDLLGAASPRPFSPGIQLSL